MTILGLSKSLLILAATVVSGAAGSPAEDSTVVRTFSEITTPPADSADAERVRIWLPVERGGNCRVRVDIVDDSGRVIRRLVDRGLASGYYNFYWDKKDDQGRFVAPGIYRYNADDCGRKVSGQVRAEFHPWELNSRLITAGFVSDTCWLELLADSAEVTAVVMNQRGGVMDSLMADSLLNTGRHLLQWIPPTTGYTGEYLLRVEVGGFVYPQVLIRAARP